MTHQPHTIILDTAQNNINNTINLALKHLLNNEIIAFPTETVYGLGARVFSPAAIEKIYQAKGRPSDNPLIAHIANINQAHQLSDHLPETFFKLASYFFPGPLTLIVSKSTKVPDIGTAGLKTISIRMPNHPVPLALISALNEPIFAPSANLSGKPSPTNAQDVYEDLQGKVPLILDGGPCSIGIESTVLDITSNTPTILRPGVITATEISSVLGQQVNQFSSISNHQIPKSPGTKYRHYSPQAKIQLIYDWNTVQISSSEKPHTIILSTNPSNIPPSIGIDIKHLAIDSVFATFRQADREGKHLILIDLRSSDLPEGLFDRVTKAAA